MINTIITTNCAVAFPGYATQQMGYNQQQQQPQLQPSGADYFNQLQSTNKVSTGFLKVSIFLCILALMFSLGSLVSLFMFGKEGIQKTQATEALSEDAEQLEPQQSLKIHKKQQLKDLDEKPLLNNKMQDLQCKAKGFWAKYNNLILQLTTGFIVLVSLIMAGLHYGKNGIVANSYMTCISNLFFQLLAVIICVASGFLRKDGAGKLCKAGSGITIFSLVISLIMMLMTIMQHNKASNEGNWRGYFENMYQGSNYQPFGAQQQSAPYGYQQQNPYGMAMTEQVKVQGGGL